MADNTLKVKIQHLYHTEAEWQTLDPVLLAGEIAISSDKNLTKTGNGTSKWSQLAYDVAKWADITGRPSSMKNPNALTIKLNGTSQGSYDGSTAKEINVTADSVGAMPKSGGSFTGGVTMQGSQYADSYSGALNMNNSNIYGLNSIYTSDVSDNAQEGIHFYRDSTHVDTLWMKSGDLKFVPNRKLGENGTSYSVLHTGNYTDTVTPASIGAAVNTALGNVDLNTVTTPGFYNATGGNTCTNKPTDVDAFGLTVIHNAGGGYYTQLLTVANNTHAGKTFRRTMTNNTWSSWSEDKYTDTTSFIPLTGGTTSGAVVVGSSKMPLSAGKITGFTKNQTAVYSDGIAISNPATPNDIGFMRVTGTGEADTVLEIATGDDGGTGEKIVARQYTTSNTVKNEAVILGTDGETSFPVSVTAPKFIGSATEAQKLIIDSKTYTGVIASANDFANGTFYFGTVKPDSFSKAWHIKYKITATVPGQTNYNGFFEVDMWSSGTTRMAYKCQNNHYSTSYRTLYYHVLYSTTSAGFTSGYGHAVGIGLNNSTNPTSSTYARTFSIELLEADNCEFTFLDSMKKYSALDGTGSTNYSGYSQWDGYNNGLRETGDDNTYDQLTYSNFRITAGSILYQTALLLSPDNQTYYSIVTSRSTATTKTCTTQGFRPETITYMAGSQVAANGTTTAWGATRAAYPSADFRYSSNCAQTLTANKSLYLKTTYNPTTDLYYLVSDGWYSQTLPTSEDGYYYIYLGQTYSTYQFNLVIDHPVYYYKNGALREVGGSASTDDAGNIISSTYLPLSGGTVTGQIIGNFSGAPWYGARDKAVVKVTNYDNNSVYPILSAKSGNGTWDVTTYTNNKLHFSYITDENYTSKINTQTADIIFGADGNVSAKSFTGSLSGTATNATNLTSNPTVAWNAGTSAGPTLAVTAGNKTSTAVAIPTATASASGVVTTGAQTFAGNKTFTGSVILTKGTDADGTANNSPALIVGGATTATHLELDGNEIMAKANGATVGVLNLNLQGGAICSGNGGYHTVGPVGIGSALSSGIVSTGVKMVYDSTNKCLNFNFVG